MAPRSIHGTREQWQRVAAVVRTRRETDLELSIEALASKCEGKPSGRTITAIENVERLAFSETSIRRLSKALGFGDSGLESILTGSEPPVPDLGGGAPAWASEIVQLLRELLVEIRGERVPDGGER